MKVRPENVQNTVRETEQSCPKKLPEASPEKLESATTPNSFYSVPLASALAISHMFLSVCELCWRYMFHV